MGAVNALTRLRCLAAAGGCLAGLQGTAGLISLDFEVDCYDTDAHSYVHEHERAVVCESEWEMPLITIVPPRYGGGQRVEPYALSFRWSGSCSHPYFSWSQQIPPVNGAEHDEVVPATVWGSENTEFAHALDSSPYTSEPYSGLPGPCAHSDDAWNCDTSIEVALIVHILTVDRWGRVAGRDPETTSPKSFMLNYENTCVAAC